MNRGLWLAGVSLVFASPAAAQTLISDFESFTAPTANGTVLFRDPRFSGSTSGNLLTDPNLSQVVKPDGGVGGNVTNVLKTNFQFIDGEASRWLRLTTFNATNLKNPTVDFTQWLKFDVYTTKDITIAIGLRETNTTAAIGENGGTSGSIEWVSNDSLSGTGGPGGGTLITAGSWFHYAIDLAAPPVVKGFTGNGVLESTTGKGVLENFGIKPVGGDAGPYEVYFDNIRQEAVPEPATLVVLGLGALALRRRRSQ
ncbi:MAG: PEP-CTERM sorting domain-containing protein [Fimbriimonadaceae bacterium]|nr:PEP-CTERM sorting domain-containing protein [Fimbriimonadaceae bacterium]